MIQFNFPLNQGASVIFYSIIFDVLTCPYSIIPLNPKSCKFSHSRGIIILFHSIPKQKKGRFRVLKNPTLN